MVRAVKRLVLATCLATSGASAAPARVAPSAHFTLAGDPTPVLTNEQRALLQIRFGPDAPIDFFQAKNGNYYINSAGSLGPARGPGRPAAWNLRVDGQLTTVLSLHGTGPAAGPDDVQTILTTHQAQCGSGPRRRASSEPGAAACTQYFDRDYAGGGTYFRCPNNGPSVYFYHGENHTAPDGSWGHGGWFGLGMGVFNASETAVSRPSQMQATGGAITAQVIGMNVTTIWHAQGGGYQAPPQEHPYNGVASAIAGADNYLYLYYGNATFDPAYNPAVCHPECMAVARAPVAQFCSSVSSGAPVRFYNYYRGGWTQPALNGANSPLGFGSGGPFTPIVDEHEPGEHGGTVTFLPARRLYVMARLYADGIDLRTSSDGLTWSVPQNLVQTPTGTTPNGDPERLLYPKICVIHDAAGAEHYVLTYVLATHKPFWKWAEFMRQKLDLRGG